MRWRGGHRMGRVPRPAAAALTLALTLAVSVAGPRAGLAASGEAKGTLILKGKTVRLTHAYLVAGPDAVDSSRTVRRLILSGKDLEATIRDCQSMSCTDAALMEGLVVDIGDG